MRHSDQDNTDPQEDVMAELRRMSEATADFERMLRDNSARSVLEAYVTEQFEETAAMAARPGSTPEDRATYCGQMAVWLKLKQLTKG